MPLRSKHEAELQQRAAKKSAFRAIEARHFAGMVFSSKMALTGHSLSQAPQQTHDSGSMLRKLGVDRRRFLRGPD